MDFSDFIIYVDESGDHGLVTIDREYPVFVLAFCVFNKTVYGEECVPHLQRLKFKHFGHDMVVFHEREIRKALGDFVFLVNPKSRKEFMDDVTGLVETAKFTVIASAINKLRLQEQYVYPKNPYDLALAFCLERLRYFLQESGDSGRTAHVVFESRGTREDRDLELVFRRVCGGASYAGALPFEPVFVPKQVNCCGLQIADLIARPIGRHVLDPGQPNRAYSIIESKFRRRNGRIEGAGLKIFP